MRYSMRRLRRKVPDKFILVTMAGAADVDEKSLFPPGERGTLVQESLSEAVDKIRSVAVGADKHKETPSDASGSQTPSFTPKIQPELRVM
jgi:hypothetical protein